MKILAIDTSSTSGSVALTDDGRLIEERTVGDVGTHADWLMRGISGLLTSSGQPINEVDLFALTIGPGSFTGLRIGVSTVKGLAWSLGKPVAGVSTLVSLASNLRYTDMTVCPVLDARKREVYTALYRFEGGEAIALLPDSALSPKRLFEKIAELIGDGPLVFLGSGLGVYGELIKENVPWGVFTPEPLWHSRAANIALLAEKDASRWKDAISITPLYLRKSEAELKKGATSV